ncbi:MAG: hypothetical protein QM820_50885 [Minicystis sp.]
MRTLPRILPAFALLLAACGGEPAPVAPPQATAEATAAPAPPPPPAPTAEPTAAPTAAPSATASAGPAKPPPKQSSGRPAVMKSDPKEITDSFGSTPASKLELGDKDIATLRIPEGALRQATNITFRIDARGKANGAPSGKIYQISANYPPSGAPESIESQGDPFVLELPAGAKKDANLAIGIEDEKGRVKWTVVAPKRIDDVRNVAIFELGTLPSGWLHVTAKAPTAAK